MAYQRKLPGFPESGFSVGPSALSVATAEQTRNLYFQHLNLLEKEYGGKHVIIINGNETTDGKTKFYIEPAIRGKSGNLTRDEFNVLYPNASPHGFYIHKERDKGRILTVTS